MHKPLGGVLWENPSVVNVPMHTHVALYIKDNTTNAIYAVQYIMHWQRADGKIIMITLITLSSALYAYGRLFINYHIH